MAEQGVVREWWAEEGWGVVESPATPGGCWAHFSVVAVPGYRTLSAGQQVLLDIERVVDQDGFRFVASRVWSADAWTPELLLAAVRQRVHADPHGDGEVPMQADLVDGDLLVTFGWPGEVDRLGLRFPLSEAPVGPSAGEVCATPSEWATEVGFVLMEELDTGLTRRAPRSVTANGVVELQWRPVAH